MSGGSQKYEREIAEILERLERDEPKGERVKRQTRQTVERRRQDWGNRLSGVRGMGRQFGTAAGWTWIGLTIGLGILGLLLKLVLPILGTLCAILMVLCFFSPLFSSFGRNEPSPSNMWRGKVVDLRPRGFFANLRYQWRRFLNGGRPFR
jgi:hypothetical protein